MLTSAGQALQDAAVKQWGDDMLDALSKAHADCIDAQKACAAAEDRLIG